MMTTKMTALKHEQIIRDEILVERTRQDHQWGGPVHDDTHTPADWKAFLTEHTAKALRTTLSSPISSTTRTIQIAALGFAVADCLERERGRHALDQAMAEAAAWGQARFPDMHQAYIAWRAIEVVKELARLPRNVEKAADLLILLAVWAEKEGVNLAQAVREKLTANVEHDFDIRSLSYLYGSAEPVAAAAPEEE